MKMKYIIIALVVFCTAGMLLFSCKKFTGPAPLFEEYTLDSSAMVRQKVLVISIDGATGSEVSAANLPKLNELLATSKYSFNFLKDAVTTNVSGWVNMLTGVSFSRHQIRDSSFFPERTSSGDKGDHDPIPYFPTVFDFIYQNKPQYKTAIVTRWAGLADYCGAASFKTVAATDAAVKDAAVSRLKEAPLALLVVQFSDVMAAGLAGSFSVADPGYKAALKKTDEYVGNIVQALKQRPDYDKENWLVMVTTNHGGSEADPKNGFIVCSNPKLKKGELKKSGFTTVLFDKKDIFAEVVNDNGLYDSKPGDEFTVQMQMKVLSPGNYPAFLSKSTDQTTGDNLQGWLWLMSDGAVETNFGPTGGGGRIYGKGKNIADASWHTVTMVIRKSGDTREVLRYTDGKPDGSTSLGSMNISSPTQQLHLGYKNGWGSAPISFYAADLLYFKKALDESTIAANVGLKDITKHPDYTSLAGYWRVDDGGGAVITNRAPVGYDMVLGGAYKWVKLGDDVPVSMEVPANYDPLAQSIVASSTDPASNCIYWMNLSGAPNASAVNTSWLANYNAELQATK